MWRALIYRVTVKQRAKREQTYPVCLHAVVEVQNGRVLIRRMIAKQQVKNDR